MTPGDTVEVRLVKPNAQHVVYPAVVVSDDGNHLVVRAPWVEPEARDIGFAIFGPGDIFTEHYWRDRWYSVKEVRTADGAVKGWYTDIARPVRVDGPMIVSEDLYLDLWLSGDRQTILRLDEDEFAASGLEKTDPEVAREARMTLDYLAGRAADDWDAVLR